MATQRSIKVNVTIPLPETQPQPNTAQSPVSAASSGGQCTACGKCRRPENPKPLLQHAGETLLNLAAGAYTLEQLSAALEIIETLLKRHYDNRHNQ